ncbi:MAG: NAD-dependent protein deacylase [Clostridia bacterium]|nr:NAD-dependent protein deacylase [Clostridia bacterium]
MDDIKKFAEMIKQSDNIVFFGGAGVSTESGLKDYRSEDGIYNTVKEFGISPEEILSINFMINNPETFYRFYTDYFLKVTAEPNSAHISIAKLEQIGKIKAVITQNIDGLHQLAGSKNVLELHGTINRYFCMNCKMPYSKDEVTAMDGGKHTCSNCGGLVRPEVTLYGEMLNSDVETKAVNAILDADMLIVGGTSLAVYPAAAYLNYFKGKYTVLINKQTTAFDSRADLIFRENIGKVFEETLNLL